VLCVVIVQSDCVSGVCVVSSVCVCVCHSVCVCGVYSKVLMSGVCVSITVFVC
jgi:hypothetical protein